MSDLEEVYDYYDNVKLYNVHVVTQADEVWLVQATSPEEAQEIYLSGKLKASTNRWSSEERSDRVVTKVEVREDSD